MLSLIFIGLPAKSETSDSSKILAARGVLVRVLGSRANTIKLEMIPAANASDTYEYSASKGNLLVKGTSVIALTRGVYDYLRKNNLGMLDWAGPQFDLPKRWPDAPLTKLTSPFRIRQAYNVVTSGYTTPYWSRNLTGRPCMDLIC